MINLLDLLHKQSLHVPVNKHEVQVIHVWLRDISINVNVVASLNYICELWEWMCLFICDFSKNIVILLYFLGFYISVLYKNYKRI